MKPAAIYAVTSGGKLKKNHRFEIIEGRVEIVGAGAGYALGPDRSRLPPCSGLSRRGLEAAEKGLLSGAAADLDSPCARRRRRSTVGTEESLRRGRTKESIEARERFTTPGFRMVGVCRTDRAAGQDCRQARA